MEIKKMIAELKKNWLVSAVICILAGLVLVIWPVETLHSACYVLGGIAIAAGIIRVVRYFKESHIYPVIFQNDLLVGLLTMGLGLFMITRADAVTDLIPILFAITLIGFGISAILRAVDAKRTGFEAWGIQLAMAILTVALGWLILLNPFTVKTVITILAGAGLIYEGVTDILVIRLVGKRIEMWRRAQENRESV